MKKHIFAALTGAALVLSLLAGCKSIPPATSAKSAASAASATSATSEPSVQTSPAEKKKPEEFGVYDMAYVLSTRDEYLEVLEKCVLESAYDNCITMEEYYAGEDSGKMIDCIAEAREAGKQAVLINLIAAEDAPACINAAGDMKVVFINRLPEDFSILGESAAAVSSNEYAAGVYQGHYLAEHLKSAGKDSISYVLFRGTEGLIHTDLRTNGALDTLKEAGFTLEEAAVINADYDRLTAKDAFADLIPGLEFDCIISNNDAMALGAIASLEDAGIDPSSIPIVGIDATEDGKKAIRNGKMAMTVFQSAYGQANASIIAAINMLEDVNLAEGTECDVSPESEYVLYYPYVPVTIDNVNSIE